MRSFLSLSLLAGLSLVVTPAAWAACTGPNGQAGDTVYSGNFGTLAYCDGTDWVSTAGGPTVNIGGSTNNPGGADTYIQFNSGGTSFGGSAGLTWNNSTSTLTATNIGAAAVTATTLGGTLSTAAQPNITTVGTLTGLTMGGHINAVGYNVSATNVYASSVSGSSGTFGALTVNGVPVTGNAQGDRISTSGVVSGATLGMAVADRGTISFTLGGTAGAAYLHPTLGLVGPGVSTTGPVSAASVFTPGNVSASSINTVLGHFSGQMVGALKGAGGSFISSGTTQVSASAVGSIKFASAGTLAMTISGSNVGIGTAAPSNTLHVNGAVQVGNRLTGKATFGSDYFWLGLGPNGAETSNLAIGIAPGNAAATVVSQVMINTGGVKRLLVNESGNVGIGTTSPNAKLDVNGSIIAINLAQSGQIMNVRSADNVGPGYSTDANLVFGNLGGTYQQLYWNHGSNSFALTNNLTITGTGTICTIGTGTGATNCTSDKRLKKDIATISGALEKIKSLNGVTFHWKDPKKAEPEHIGVIAQDVEKVFPQAVGQVSDTTLGTAKTVDIAALVAPLIEAVKELDARSKQLKADNDNLRAELRLLDDDRAAIDSLRREFEALKAARH